MSMQVPLRMISLVSWRLMKTHGIRKRSVEYLVGCSGNLLQDFRESIALPWIQLRQVWNVRAADQDDFEGPDSPVRNESNECVILDYHTLFRLKFQFQVVT